MHLRYKYQDTTYNGLLIFGHLSTPLDIKGKFNSDPQNTEIRMFFFFWYALYYSPKVSTGLIWDPWDQ